MYKNKDAYRHEQEGKSNRTIVAVVVVGLIVWAAIMVLPNYVEIAAFIFSLGGGK